ncbi:MAG: hypothetical protein RLY31_2436 [Bacteroidota bacterium]
MKTSLRAIRPGKYGHLPMLLSWCILFTTLVSGAGNSHPVDGRPVRASTTMTGKVTFRVDTRNITVAASGMFVAGNFLSSIGYTNWTFQPMCDLGGGIWELSFADIPAGLYQYKFVNGNAPAGWEFNGFGGACTNPADNNNRWLTVTGAIQTEGPFCFNTCDVFCPGLGDPGVSDQTPPLILDPVPADITLSCTAPLPVAISLAAEDGCDINVTTTTGPPADDLSGLSSCGTGTILRTWTATDCAGNSAEAVQTITILDNQPPQITGVVPVAVTTNCGDLPVPVPLDAADLCDQTLTSTGLPTDNNNGIGPCGTGILLRIWTATDCSGNNTTATQTITLTDTEPPTITGMVPPNLTVSCQDIPTGGPLAAEDACDGTLTTTASPVDDLSGLSPCGTGTILRTWTATDCAGNSTTVSQLITVIDNSPPTISPPMPSQLTIDCQQPLPPALALPATDACDATLLATSLPTDDLSGLGPCGTGTILRTWTATDCNGNMASVTQTIIIIDLTPPDILGVPADLTIDCNIDLPPAMPLQAADGCDLSLTSTLFPTDNLNGPGPCGTGTVQRTWTATDCAGNIRTATQLITIADLAPPVLTGPAPPDLSISCGNLPPGLPIGATDLCDPQVQQSSPPIDDLTGLTACGTGLAVRSWTLADCSANTAVITQLITLTDTSPPVLTFPTASTFTCGNVPTPTQLPPAVHDDCDPSPSLVLLATDTLGSGCSFEIRRTWSATDCNGNTVTDIQVIPVADEEPPQFVAPPADLSVCIGDVPPMQHLTWTDACDGTGTVAGTSQSNGASNPETITRTWQYTDACGNMVSHTQLITVSSSGQAFAGPDQTICAGDSALLSAAGFGQADSLIWSTLGDGSFSQPTAASGSYFPGPSDESAGSVTLVFTPIISNGNCIILPDTLLLTITPRPAAEAGPDQTIRCNQPLVTLDASGSTGGPATSYTWAGPGLAGDSTGLTVSTNHPGIYLLTVSTGNCSETDSVTISLDTLAPTVAAGDDLVLSCSQPFVTLGGQTAANDSTAIQWNGPGLDPGGSGDPQPTVSIPGTYVLTATDLLNGCSSQDTVTVLSDGLIPVATINTPSNLTCALPAVWLDGGGSSQGPHITFQWMDADGPVSDSSATLVSIPGTYTLVVTDTSNGCSSEESVTVSADTLAPGVDAGANQVLTCANPSVTLGTAAAAGTAFLYSWRLDGLSVGQTDTLLVQLPGQYTLTVTHPGNGCIATDSVLVTADSVSPTAAGGPDHILTCTVQSAVLSGSAASANGFLANWSGPNLDTDSLQPTVLQAGEYLLTVQDTGNGCSMTDTVRVFLDTLPPQALAGPDQTLTCTIQAVQLIGGAEPAGLPVQFRWLDAAGTLLSPDSTLFVQVPGIFRLVVTGTANGCSDTVAVAVDQDTIPPLALAGPDDTLTCQHPFRLLEAGTSQGAGPLQYNWSGPGGNAVGSSLSASLPGPYILTVTDESNGCVATDTLQLTEDLAVPEASAGPDQTLTCIQPSVLLTGSASPVQVDFQWTGPGITPITAGLPQPVVTVPGVYELTVTSQQNGCSSLPASVSVSVDTFAPTAQLSSYGQLTCDSQQVWIDGSASSLGSSYSHTWTADGILLPGAGQAGLLTSQPGTYVLTVTNQLNGCTQTATASIIQDTVAPVIAILGPTQLSCYNPVAALSASLANAVDAPSYSWTTQDGNLLTDPMAPAIQTDAAGTYLLQVTDGSNGCTTTTTYEVAADTTPPVIDLPAVAVIGCQSATVTLSPVFQANGPLSVQWTGPAGFNSTSANPAVPAAGTYQLSVTQLFNGCSAMATVDVSVDPGISAVSIDVTPAACEGRPGGSIEVTSVTGTGTPFAYALDGTAFNGSPVFSGLYAGHYTLTVVNATGCTFEQPLTVTALTPPTLFVGEDRTILLGDSVQLTANLSGPSYLYLWTDSGTLSCGDCPDPVAKPFETTEYELTVMDDNGCEQTAAVRITVDPRLRLYIPDVFSPNGDGINDQFRLYPGPQVLSVKSLRIFDRWGGLVADLSDSGIPDAETGWDGTKSGDSMPAGVYLFTATVILVDGRQQLVRGEVLLLP